MSVQTWTTSIEDRERLIQAAIEGTRVPRPHTRHPLIQHRSEAGRVQPLLKVPRWRGAPRRGREHYQGRKRRECFLRCVVRPSRMRGSQCACVLGATICAERTALVKAVVCPRSSIVAHHAGSLTSYAERGNALVRRIGCLDVRMPAPLLLPPSLISVQRRRRRALSLWDMPPVHTRVLRPQNADFPRPFGIHCREDRARCTGDNGRGSPAA